MARSNLRTLSVDTEKQSPIQTWPLVVEADATGAPISLKLISQWIDIREVVDRWMIDEEWASGQTVRWMYWECLVSKGLRVVVHQDLDSVLWYW